MTPTRDPDLEITEVRIRMAEETADGQIAWASCVVNGSLFLNNIAIRRCAEGELVLTFPAKRSRRDMKYFYFRPINAGAKEALDRAILKRLQDLVEER